MDAFSPSLHAAGKSIMIGALYLDNITYAGTQITEDNYKEYTNIALDDGARFSESSIKINQLSDE